MIPVDKVIPGNLYCQDDAQFLLGSGFSKAAAKEAISEAARAGQLTSKQWRKRWWFTGREFLVWVSRWFGTEIGTGSDKSHDGHGDRLASTLRVGDNSARRLGARSPENGKEVGT